MAPWSRDGRYLLFRTIALEHGADVHLGTAARGRQDAVPGGPHAVRGTRCAVLARRDWIAYHSNESGQFEVYVQPWRGEGERMRISTGGGAQAMRP